MRQIIILLFIGLGILSFRTPTTPSTATELGKQLFFDPMLSLDSTLSCASCHRPEFAFADTSALSLGVGQQLGTRNTPSSMNMLARPHFFYDGRAASIQEQVLMPIHNPVEMNLPIPVLLDRLNNSPYQTIFQQIYGRSADSANLSDALGSFVFSLESPGDSPFDRWMQGDESAMTAQQIRGRLIFNEKGKCFDCHFGPDFTGDEFRNVGLFTGMAPFDDVGRFAISKDSTDLGRFKVPGLRNIAVTAPYMHNGMFKTLEEVVDYYNNPFATVPQPINNDTLVQTPLGLTPNERADLIAFLHALTDAKFMAK